MNNKIEQFRRSLERKKGRQKELQNSIRKMKNELKQTQRSLDASREALSIIQIVAKKTQAHLEYHLSDLVSAGMAAVFPNPYQLEIDFQSRRNQVEVDMNFLRSDKKFNPAKCGGGAKDIAALALQFSIWALRKPRTRPLMLLDEPLKWLKGSDLPTKGSQMIKEISSKLHLQIIMVSHSPELIQSADKVFYVEMKNNYSIVKEE